MRLNELLVLRRWASSVLFADRDPLSAPCDVSPRSWEIFLEVERCALPLHERLSSEPSSGIVTEAAWEMIRKRALHEAHSLIIAESQLVEIGALATNSGWTICALKGTAHVADRQGAVAVADLDLLVRDEDAGSCARALETLGYDVKRPATPDPLHVCRQGTRGFQIELHSVSEAKVALEAAALDRALPIEVLPGLSRLDPVDHLWQLLVHIVLSHPNRQVALRDLFLVRRALSLSISQSAELSNRVRRHPARNAFEATLALADGMARSRVKRRASGIVAANYLLALLLTRFDPVPGARDRSVRARGARKMASLCLSSIARRQRRKRWPRLRSSRHRGQRPLPLVRSAGSHTGCATVTPTVRRIR